MFKENGYDDFLIEKIKRGLADIENGQTFTLEQANAEWQEVIDQIDEENRQFEREVVYG